MVYKFRKVFISSLDGIGQTGLVKHTTDSRLFRQPLQHLPITKQKPEQEEVKKMLDRGLMEQGTSR